MTKYALASGSAMIGSYNCFHTFFAWMAVSTVWDSYPGRKDLTEVFTWFNRFWFPWRRRTALKMRAQESWELWSKYVVYSRTLKRTRGLKFAHLAVNGRRLVIYRTVSTGDMRTQHTDASQSHGICEVSVCCDVLTGSDKANVSRPQWKCHGDIYTQCLWYE